MYEIFNKRDQQQVNNQHGQNAKLQAFYRIWTRNEALFKAIN
ncbi:4'-phosphopantetheinyl transferase superfamily protein [Oceanobacillus sp. J11TS1]|nr:hypothetical protein J11TS1_06660 [Oceanobacillus sp. J11TS1]